MTDTDWLQPILQEISDCAGSDRADAVILSALALILVELREIRMRVEARL